MKKSAVDHEKMFLDGLSEYADHKNGVCELEEKNLLVPRMSMKDVRQSLGITRQEFANRYGLPVTTLKNWEQGRREPDAAANLLLFMIDKRPDLFNEEISKLKH